ncbi:MAG: response regulator [Desulfomonile tiedjei]|nr:response regulator [Desulfomonile tiedjei]
MSPRLRILLADDEAIVRSKVLLMLGDRFDIDQATTAASARQADMSQYDATFMDIVFPDGNGIDLCREIKARDPHSTVVITSSMESVDAWNQAFQAGADGYLEKRELLSLDPRKIELMVQSLVERNRLRRQAEETNRRQAELLSVLSHDVRAPFQALLGTIELLRKSDIPEAAAGNVEKLFHCAKDQLEFINALLELLRLESAGTSIRRSAVDLNLPVNQSLAGLQVLAQRKSIALEVDLEAKLPRVESDIGKILQVVNNLITNAIKFTPGGGRVTVRTRSSSRNGRPGAEISVEDTGIGIKPEERAKIFQRFHRGRERGTSGEKGTGLGLAICKEILQLHGGTIEVVDRSLPGTLIAAWFPQSEKEKAKDPSSESKRWAGQESRTHQYHGAGT